MNTTFTDEQVKAALAAYALRAVYAGDKSAMRFALTAAAQVGEPELEGIVRCSICLKHSSKPCDKSSPTCQLGCRQYMESYYEHPEIDKSHEAERVEPPLPLSECRLVSDQEMVRVTASSHHELLTRVATLTQALAEAEKVIEQTKKELYDAQTDFS